MEIGDILYVTGQLPIDPDVHEAPLPASIEAQTEQHLPGRTTVGVAKLGRDALVEIDLVVAKG